MGNLLLGLEQEKIDGLGRRKRNKWIERSVEVTAEAGQDKEREKRWRGREEAAELWAGRGVKHTVEKGEVTEMRKRDRQKAGAKL